MQMHILYHLRQATWGRVCKSSNWLLQK